MKNNIKNKNGGFIKLIIFIVIALLLMKFFNITFSEIITWFKSFFGNILQ